MLSQVTMEIGARCLYQEVWRFGTQFLPDLSASIRLRSYQGEPETCPFPVGWGAQTPQPRGLCPAPPRYASGRPKDGRFRKPLQAEGFLASRL